jgi:hypothetical protein
VEGTVLFIAEQKIVFILYAYKRERNHPQGGFGFLRSFYFLNPFTLFREGRWGTLSLFKVESQHEKISTEREEK